MNATLLTFENVTVRHLNQVLFTGLTFRVEQGQSWALVGASGAGKSALLATLAGSCAVTAGTASYPFWEVLARQQPVADPFFTWRQLVGYVGARADFRTLANTSEFYYQQRFNAADSEDALTVRQYLEAVRSYAVRPYWTYERTVEKLGLRPLQDQRLIKLSNGETKRLRVAAALLRNPALLLLDTPFAGLDTQTRAAFQQLLTDITASGITIVLATAPAEVPACVSHVAVLVARKIVKVLSREQFTPRQVQPAEPTSLDETELRALLALTPLPPFDCIVRLEDVCIRYGGKLVLDQINWEVLPGQRWALVGPNGAGKSTLLSLLNGDNPQAYAQRITLFDRRRGSGESIWDIKRKIGFVSPELFQYFPVGNACVQIIESGFYDTLGLLRPSNAANAAVARRWLRLLRLEEYAATPLRKVPASVQRLCLLARALVKNPPLLIFDEPCQDLDERQQAHFRQVLDSICRASPVTLIYVSHYAAEIPASVTHVLRLEAGRQVA